MYSWHNREQDSLPSGSELCLALHNLQKGRTLTPTQIQSEQTSKILFNLLINEGSSNI